MNCKILTNIKPLHIELSKDHAWHDIIISIVIVIIKEGISVS